MVTEGLRERKQWSLLIDRMPPPEALSAMLFDGAWWERASLAFFDFGTRFSILYLCLGLHKLNRTGAKMCANVKLRHSEMCRQATALPAQNGLSNWAVNFWGHFFEQKNESAGKSTRFF